GKHSEILRPKVVTILWSPKVKALVAHVAFGVLAVVTDSLRSPGQNFNGKRSVSLPPEPHDGPPFLMRKAAWPDERLADHIGKLCKRLIRSSTNCDNCIH